jgi:hypothetical protein
LNLDDILGSDYPNFSEHGTPPCAETDPEAFFPEPKVPGAYVYAQMAVKVCLDCPYRRACLEYATENRLPGIWGGTSEIARRRLRMRDRDKYPKRW